MGKIETLIVLPSDLRQFREETSEGAIYIARAKIKHLPLYSGMVVGPSLKEDEMHTIVPLPAIKKKYLAPIKVGEEGRLVDCKYDARIIYLKINWKEAIQIYYSNPSDFSRQRHGVSLEDMFETSRFVFAQSPYFSSWASKSNLDGAQEPNTPPTLVGGS